MKKIEAINKIKNNILKRFENKYNINFYDKNKIIFNDKNDHSVILYTVLIETPIFSNNILVKLYGGDLLIPLTRNQIKCNSEKENFEILP